MKRQFNLSPIANGLGNDNRYQPQYTNHFEVFLYLPKAIANDDEIKVGEFRKGLSFATTDFQKPGMQVQSQSAKYGNSAVEYATGDSTPHTTTLNCVDYIGLDIEQILRRWMTLSYNHQTGQVGWIGEYKTMGYVIEYAGDGNCINQWDLINVWPSNLTFDPYSRDNGGLKKCNLTLTFDDCIPNEAASTRGTYAEAAKSSALNMVSKPQDEYATENEGGPINPYKSPL